MWQLCLLNPLRSKWASSLKMIFQRKLAFPPLNKRKFTLFMINRFQFLRQLHSISSWVNIYTECDEGWSVRSLIALNVHGFLQHFQRQFPQFANFYKDSKNMFFPWRTRKNFLSKYNINISKIFLYNNNRELNDFKYYF